MGKCKTGGCWTNGAGEHAGVGCGCDCHEPRTNENDFDHYFNCCNRLTSEASRLTQLLSQERDDFGKKEIELKVALREAYEKGLEDAAEISLDYCIDLDCPNYHDDEILLKSHLQGVTMKIMKLKRPVGGEK